MVSTYSLFEVLISKSFLERLMGFVKHNPGNWCWIQLIFTIQGFRWFCVLNHNSIISLAGEGIFKHPHNFFFKFLFLICMIQDFMFIKDTFSCFFDRSLRCSTPRILADLEDCLGIFWLYFFFYIFCSSIGIPHCWYFGYFSPFSHKGLFFS